MLAPRLTLLTPFRWLRDDKNPLFEVKLKLTSQRIDFPAVGVLERAEFIASVKGQSPFRFNMKAEL
ncbi:C4-dicarboxylate ABC transporter, partial [Proteus mirabilis]|uniref:hypothetical protein n=1 Tax=Proteus mirabilis TaxID=584 RepID=UPI0025763A46